MRIGFHTLGCKVNACETERMIHSFKEAGHEIGDFDEINDVYIVNTCTVTNIADRKSRQMLHRAKAVNPGAVVAACGCFAETGSKGALKDEAIDLLIGNKDKERAVEIIESYIREKEASGEGEEYPDALSEPQSSPFGTGVPEPACNKESSPICSLHDHTRAYIKVQDGCDQFCSYCIIPYVRGRIRSRDEKDVLSEIQALARGGIKEVVLTGIHLSSYGIDLYDERTSYNELARNGEYVNARLISLIEKTCEVNGIERVRLGSLEPRIITAELLSAVKAAGKVCPHFHLSLQSGSDRVLKRMNRHYSTGEYLEKTALIRSFFEHPAITTDIITGFPGETEEEFLETRDFLNRAQIYETHLFKYSRRRGTAADKMEGQLTEKEKARRSGILAGDDRIRRRRFGDYYAGTVKKVLFEEKKEIEGEEYYVGFTEEYVKTACRAGEDLTNRILAVNVTDKYIDEQLLVFFN